jgi:Soluble lytic murein transglycosylase and related regulatory proteins (some contain LysM/invasin domains)
MKMNRHNILILLIFTLLLPIVASSQNTDEMIVIKNFERNYDSLLTGFYVRQNSNVIRSTYNRSIDNSFSQTAACNVPDSVFARRLRSLPSSIKLTYNSKVRSIIEYYIDKSGAKVSVILGLSKYYFPILEEILDQYSAPVELKYLVVIESALNPNAQSKVGAVGLWQFMYSTGRMYGLRVNSMVDDRKDPIKATVAAALYLKDLYKIYNDWSLALAAYNCGPGNVNKAIRRSGKNDFWGIYDYLPQETRGYIPAYIAAAYVMNFYREHNITPAILTKPVATDTVNVKKDIDFAQIEAVLHIPTAQIKDLNPQYKQNKIMGSQDKYSLKLPISYIQNFVSLEDSISNYNKEEYFEPQWKPEVPKQWITKEVQLTHKVRKRENWTSIAKKYGVTVQELKSWNGNVKYVQLGQLLVINKTQKVQVDSVANVSKSPFNTPDNSAVESDIATQNANSTISQDEQQVVEQNSDNQEDGEGEVMPINIKPKTTTTTAKPVAKKERVKKQEKKVVQQEPEQEIEEEIVAKAKKSTTVKHKARPVSDEPVIVNDNKEQDKQDELEMLNQITNKKTAKISKNTKVDKTDKQAKQTKKEKKEKATKAKSHTIQKGESVEKIAKKYGVSQEQIIRLNKLNKKNPKITTGDKLIIQ